MYLQVEDFELLINELVYIEELNTKEVFKDTKLAVKELLEIMEINELTELKELKKKNKTAILNLELDIL